MSDIALKEYLQHRIDELRRELYATQSVSFGYELQGMVKQVIHIAKEFDIEIDTNREVNEDG